MIPTTTLLEAIRGQGVAENPKLPTIVNAAGKDATIYLYDRVSQWTPAAATVFQQQLTAIKAPVINLRINSPGGSVFEGLAIYQLLKAHPAKVIAHVDGIAASIASIIMLAADEIHIAEGGMVMVHDASIATAGNAKQLRADADLVAKISESLTDIYVSRTGKPRGAIRAAMEAETWFNADESIKFGLASKKVTGARAAAQWNPADFPQLPTHALAAAGLSPTDSRRAINAEIDRLRNENALLRAKATAKATATPAPPPSLTPINDHLKSLPPASRTQFFKENKRALSIELTNVATMETRAKTKALLDQINPTDAKKSRK